MKKLLLGAAVGLVFVFSSGQAHACNGQKGIALTLLNTACSLVGCGNAMDMLDQACDEVANLDSLMAELETTGSISGPLSTTSVVSTGGGFFGDTVTTVRQSFSQAVAERFLTIQDIAQDMNDAIDAGVTPSGATEAAVNSELQGYLDDLNDETDAIMNIVDEYAAIDYEDRETTTTTCGIFGCGFGGGR